jgi:hypothetical protein
VSDREFYGKEDEKQEEKWNEKWSRDPLSSAVWAMILIWIGVMLLMANMDILDDVRILNRQVEIWSLGFLGAGAIVFLEVIVRLLIPTYRRNVTGTFIFAVFLVAVGLGEIVSWEMVGPLMLIALGVSVLLGGISRRR